MSRLLLNNSTVLQRAAASVSAASAAGIQSSTTTTTSNQSASRRWKSLYQQHNRNNEKKQSRFTSFSQVKAAKAHTSTMPQSRCLEMGNINPHFIALEYAVRGPLVIRAAEIEEELKKGVKKPFDQVIRANIGDCHAMGQHPITFLRQLLALTYDTSLFDSPDYPEDVKQRARDILKSCSGGSVGSYTDSHGIEVVRQQVAKFIQERDGVPSDWHDIYLTGGASPAIKTILALLHNHIDNKPPGIMVPIPQYPLYSATITEYGMERIGYYLEEESNWGLNRAEMQRAFDEGKKNSTPRAIVIINPGNPTGQVLTHDNIVDIIKFAYDNKLVLLADEVYQDNIYDKNSKFYSFKKVLNELGAPYKDMELISFMSTSKGYLGECGIRGGYMEVLNMCPKVKAILSKTITAALCSTTAGQVAVSALVHPPRKGECSYEQYMQEKNHVLGELKVRAELIHKTMNTFKGFKLNVVQGAMYAFPQITIPPKAIQAAKEKNQTPDTFYAFELLEATGICIIPGSGFGQKPGTYHFRTTILPKTEQLKIMLNKFKDFHTEFLKKYE